MSSRDSDEKQDAALYKVVVDQQDQYSIWPADRENPLGWRETGMSGTRRECLAYIKKAPAGERPQSTAGEPETGLGDDPNWRGDL